MLPEFHVKFAFSLAQVVVWLRKMTENAFHLKTVNDVHVCEGLSQQMILECYPALFSVV